MPILLDTNAYLFAIKSDTGAEFFERRFLPLTFPERANGRRRVQPLGRLNDHSLSYSSG